MITQRFKPLGWVAGVATATIGLYLVSAQVAAERTRLETIDRKIADTRREIRQLQTELGARASLRQLERWNGESLGLATPAAGQFLGDEEQLARLDGAKLGTKPSDPPPVMMAAATIAPAPQPGAPATPAAAPAAQAAAPERQTLLTAIREAAAGPRPVKLTQHDKTVQAAIAAKPKPAERRQVAVNDGALLDAKLLKDISARASVEGGKPGKEPK